MTRERLPNRRKCLTLEFQHAGQTFRLSTGYFGDGRLAEVFLSAHHVGSPLEALARDSAILVSLCLQHGVAIETIKHALTRDHDGSAATAISAAIDLLAGGSP
jgi:ribonucleoside-diphosphate reductase alpha chain